MTATEKLKRRLDQLPEQRREAVAARFLSELEGEQNAASDQDDGSHPLPGVERVPFERIKHLLGVGDGPGDLSTNPKYMEDFGKSSMQ